MINIAQIVETTVSAAMSNVGKMAGDIDHITMGLPVPGQADLKSLQIRDFTNGKL